MKVVSSASEVVLILSKSEFQRINGALASAMVRLSTPGLVICGVPASYLADRLIPIISEFGEVEL